MNTYRYILEPYKGLKTRYRCPSCQRDKEFVRYIDTQTGEHVHPDVGRCNRENNCGYHYTPRQYFQDNNISFDTYKTNIPASIRFKNKRVVPHPQPASYIPVDIFKASLKNHETNYFVQFLTKKFGYDVTSELVSRYFIGTSKHWEGSTVFWQVDLKGKIRTGKIMLYNPVNGKRVKEPYDHICGIHKKLNLPEFNLKQCLFGEHQLIDKTKPVAVVESEKTAIIASVYLPQFIWVAVGGINSLNADKCSVLIGRSVILFPDLNAFEKWSDKAKELSHLANFTVSDLLERKATSEDRKQGLDLADYLLKHDPYSFALHEPKPSIPPTHTEPLVNVLEQRVTPDVFTIEIDPYLAQIPEVAPF
jgi:rubredoxin